MKNIITISREFGSGGRELGKRLAEKLGFAYYDREIIEDIAKRTGKSEEYVNEITENDAVSYPFQFCKSFALYSAIQSNQVEVLVAQEKILKEIAEKGNCVIVGRAANYTLKDYEPMNLYVYASMDSKIERCKMKSKEDEGKSDKEIEKLIKQIDKKRKEYKNVITSSDGDDKSNYHLCINTSNIEIKTIVEPLAEYIKKWLEK